MNKIILLLLLVASHTYSNAQQNVSPSNGKYWETDIALGEFSFSTFLTVTAKNDEVIIRSSKNADKRLFGYKKAKLGRLFGKLPKKGRFLVIKAKQVNDSAIGIASMPVLGHVAFRGKISEKDNSLSGCFIRKGEVIAVLKGHRTISRRNDYTTFYRAIKDLTQQNIYSKQVLQTPEWKTFDKKLKTLTDKATDDIELFLGFNIMSQKLTFSHFNLVFQPDTSLDESDAVSKEPTVIFEEKTPSIAYLNIKNFSSSQKEIAAAFPRIIAKGYPNLIIDLRNNGGGGIEAAMELARYILKDSVFIGYFTTNRFKGKPNDKAALDNLQVTHAATTEALIDELKTSAGVRLSAPKPRGATFGGKIYVLTNKNTASTCEPITYVLKHKKIATIVGETTAGAMLSAAYFTIQGRYKLVLPIADFLTYDFERIEKTGVKPDVETTSDAALEKAISLIQQ